MHSEGRSGASIRQGISNARSSKSELPLSRRFRASADSRGCLQPGDVSQRRDGSVDTLRAGQIRRASQGMAEEGGSRLELKSPLRHAYTVLYVKDVEFAPRFCSTAFGLKTRLVFGDKTWRSWTQMLGQCLSTMIRRACR